MRIGLALILVAGLAATAAPATARHPEHGHDEPQNAFGLPAELEELVAAARHARPRDEDDDLVRLDRHDGVALVRAYVCPSTRRTTLASAARSGDARGR